MYSLPSTSQTRAPRAFSAKNGCPPTARKARTGEFTPPGMCCNAWANNFSDCEWEIMRASILGRHRFGSGERSLAEEDFLQRTAFGANDRPHAHVVAREPALDRCEFGLGMIEVRQVRGSHRRRRWGGGGCRLLTTRAY